MLMGLSEKSFCHVYDFVDGCAKLLANCCRSFLCVMQLFSHGQFFRLRL